MPSSRTTGIESNKSRSPAIACIRNARILHAKGTLGCGIERSALRASLGKSRIYMESGTELYLITSTAGITEERFSAGRMSARIAILHVVSE